MESVRKEKTKTTELKNATDMNVYVYIHASWKKQLLNT